MSFDTVGTLLAAIAISLGEGLRILGYADKRQWGADEHEQLRALEVALDEAKKDFQELGPLVGGQVYYQNDCNRTSVEELRILKFKFDFHIQNFKDWARAGGPINPIWARETGDLRRELHLAQCRAAGRIFATSQEGGQGVRCLGAFLVRRRQRQHSLLLRQQRQQQQQQQQRGWTQAAGGNGGAADRFLLQDDPNDVRARYLEELAACNYVGKFERFGERDVAFVCNFCDGYLVWEDLEGMPSVRAGQDTAALLASPVSVASPLSLASPVLSRINGSSGGASRGLVAAATWQATGFSVSQREEKTVVFAPVAIANHVPPPERTGGFLARILCPYCDESSGAATPGGAGLDIGVAAASVAGNDDVSGSLDEDDRDRYVPDEGGFEDVQELQEHLEWVHTASSLPVSIPLPSAPKQCVVM